MTGAPAPHLKHGPDQHIVNTLNLRAGVAARAVAAQAGALPGLVARRGGQVLSDVSPSDGRHIVGPVHEDPRCIRSFILVLLIAVAG